MTDYVFGPKRNDNGSTSFRLWAPAANTVSLEIVGCAPIVMNAGDKGWYEATTDAEIGAKYVFRIGDQCVPDPASRFQAGDIDSPSILCDPGRYSWRYPQWRGRPWEDAVIYELHPGLMGGFNGVSEQLPRLKALGITAVELMPIADFPGRHNWGYDGVLPFAPDCTYGSPDELKALVDRAHELELMIFLDVVYNHFGPDGNWLPLYAPDFFDRDIQTPWGAAINFASREVRRFFIENALYWLNEFRFDGLRLDAVHAIADKHWLHELAEVVHANTPEGHHQHLIIENDDNDADLLTNSYDAQWNDDFHHILHSLLTGEAQGYYSDYAAGQATMLARVLAQGFAYQGEQSGYRHGARRGKPSQHLPPTAFINFLQNHDQIGNRAFGERLTALADPAALKAAIALMLLCPQIPLLFMGEEAGAREPFFYFTDYHGALAEAVREGRREEFAKFPAYRDVGSRLRLPDPNAPETYARSRPDFTTPGAEEWRGLYTELLHLRAEEITPYLRGTLSDGAAAVGPKAVIAHWRLANGSRLSLATNLDTTAVEAPLPASDPVWGTTSQAKLAAYTTLAWIAP